MRAAGGRQLKMSRCISDRRSDKIDVIVFESQQRDHGQGHTSARGADGSENALGVRCRGDCERLNHRRETAGDC